MSCLCLQAEMQEERWKRKFENMLKEVMNARADRDIHVADKIKMEEERSKLL